MNGSASTRRVRGFIHEQAGVLGATLRAARELPNLLRPADEPYRAVVLVGSGSSKNALIATAPAFQHVHRCRVVVEGPLEFLRNVRDANLGAGDAAGTLIVVVSQSGSSTTTLEALVAAQEQGVRTVALTAEPESPFGLAASEHVVLPIGREDIGPKTKGFTATEAMLVGIAEATVVVGRRSGTLLPEPERFEDWFGARLPGWEQLGVELAARYAGAGRSSDRLGDGVGDRLGDQVGDQMGDSAGGRLADRVVDHVMFVGAGRHLGTALEGSLKLQEMAGMRAAAFDLEDALHGRFHGLGVRSLLLALVGEPEDEELAVAAASVLEELGVGVEVLSTVAETAVAGSESAGSPGPRVTRLDRFPGDRFLDVLGAVVPLQTFAEHAAHALGVDPDAMRYPDLSARLGIKLPRP